MKVINISIILLLAGLISGCVGSKTYSIQIHHPISKPKSPKLIALFLDGTQNDRDSRTNVSFLSEIVKHQYKDNLYMFYNEGVGTSGRFIGAGAGWGIDKDVAEAYAFLTEYYSAGSKMYVFGFSRGSYTSRILAGMIYSVGIYDLTSFKKEDRIRISKKLYYAYKGNNKTVNGIRSAGETVVNTWGGEAGEEVVTNNIKPYLNAEIEVMGLWDTVEALGVVPTIEAGKEKILGIQDPQNIINPNGRYLDQICNVKNIYHALSLDDNRANVFTPIIISSEYVTNECDDDSEKSSINKIKEVWFSGAHADIGGGYEKNENNKKGDYTDRDVSISGVSLNWMMSEIKNDAPGLIPNYARVFENPLGYVHNAENGDMKYKKVRRHNILTDHYKKYSRYGKLRIHESVFKRLATPRTTEQLYKFGYDSEWYALDQFEDCFDKKEDGSFLFKECDAIEVVSNSPLQYIAK